MGRTNAKLNGSVDQLAKAFGGVIQEAMAASETRMEEKVAVVMAEMRDIKKDTNKQFAKVDKQFAQLRKDTAAEFAQLRKDLKLKSAVTP